MLFGQTKANRVSRFVDEIPPELIDHKNVPKGFDYHDRRQQLGFETPRRPAPQQNPYSFRPAPRQSAPKTTPAFQTGDHVRHKAFGSGTIVKMTPMGGDHLIEVSFESAGTKKLMLRAAAQHMEKIEP